MQTQQNTKAPSTELTIRGCAHISSDPEGLAEIYNGANNLVVWGRQFTIEQSKAISDLLAQNQSLKLLPIQLEDHVTPESVRSFLQQAFKRYQGVDALIDDISDLVDMFCCLFEVEKAGLRMSMLDKAMCPKFHVDRVPCRLVTTFHGAATEWLSHDSVDRTKLGQGSQGLADHESGIYQDESDVQKLVAGDVALLKGELWEGNEGAGIVHRSPRVVIEETRLMLTLDIVA